METFKTQTQLKSRREPQFSAQVMRLPNVRNTEVSRPKYGYGNINSSEDWDNYFEFTECFPNISIPRDGLTLSQKCDYFEIIHKANISEYTFFCGRYMSNNEECIKAAKLLFCSIPTKGRPSGKELNKCLYWLCERFGHPNSERKEQLQPILRTLVQMDLRALSETNKKSIIDSLVCLGADEEVLMAAMMKTSPRHFELGSRLVKGFSKFKDSCSENSLLFILGIFFIAVIVMCICFAFRSPSPSPSLFPCDC